MRPNENFRRAFSLIELLVVVAIIGVLIALLMPAMKAARDKGKAVACANNLRQLGVAIHAWMGDHNGNFIGIGEPYWAKGGSALHWHDQLGRGGYIGSQISLTKQHVDNRYPGETVNWKWPLLKCPSEPMWTTMTPTNYYSGIPYHNYLSEYVNSSYDLNLTVINITHCKCSRMGNNSWCSGTYCGQPDDQCCAIAFSKPTRSGVTPANALIVMDNRIYNHINWQLPYCSGYNANGTILGLDAAGNALPILDDPVYMHAYRHPGLKASGVFLDGHVDGVRPGELTPPAERVKWRIWDSDTGYLAAQ